MKTIALVCVLFFALVHGTFDADSTLDNFFNKLKSKDNFVGVTSDMDPKSLQYLKLNYNSYICDWKGLENLKRKGPSEKYDYPRVTNILEYENISGDCGFFPGEEGLTLSVVYLNAGPGSFSVDFNVTDGKVKDVTVIGDVSFTSVAPFDAMTAKYRPLDLSKYPNFDEKIKQDGAVLLKKGVAEMFMYEF